MKYLQVSKFWFSLFFVLISMNSFASGNANITISSSSTSNGSWSGNISGTYTFTPSSNSVVINVNEVINRLTGSGFSAGNVTINSACSGTCSQDGNITLSSAINANTSVSKNLSISAAGTINTNSPINLSGTSGAGGGNIELVGILGITTNAGVVTSGSSPTPGSNATGGSGGTITLNAADGDVNVNSGLTTNGAPGGTGGSGSGGNGGSINISANSIGINTAGVISAIGGNGPGAHGGNGGNISLTSTNAAISISREIRAFGGNAGSANTGQSGGDGGNIQISSWAGLSISADMNTEGGSNGGYFYQCGGNGGDIELFATSITIGNTNLDMGLNGGGAFCARSDGSLTQNIVLPIDLLYFQATELDDQVLLEWETLMEINNDYFQIEKSFDGINWHTLNTLPGAGNSYVPIQYGIIDYETYKGQCFYRLKQFDFDGRYHVYDAIVFKRTSNEEFVFSVFPNPVINQAELTFMIPSGGNYKLCVYDEKGKLIYHSSLTVNRGENQTKISLDNYATGVYHFVMSNEKEFIIHKKVLKR